MLCVPGVSSDARNNVCCLQEQSHFCKHSISAGKWTLTVFPYLLEAWALTVFTEMVGHCEKDEVLWLFGLSLLSDAASSGAGSDRGQTLATATWPTS